MIGLKEIGVAGKLRELLQDEEELSEVFHLAHIPAQKGKVEVRRRELRIVITKKKTPKRLFFGE